MTVFASSGVDAPVREIAERAGVGVGTLYRHFPQRSDLIVAVFQHEVDACAEAAATLAREFRPGDAVAQWMQRYVDFIAAKRGLATALHSGDAAYEALPAYFLERLGPALQALLTLAENAGEIGADATATELLFAVARLCAPDQYGGGPDQARRVVALLVDGLRHRAASTTDQPSNRVSP
ncbi:TetR/AcrR family transcriptional regulator [Frateuria aurantia]